MMPGRERIAVVGAGLMGHGIAQVFACAGHEVAITDTSPEALAAVPERVRGNLKRMGETLAAVDRITLWGQLEDAVNGADVVVEAVNEQLELKQRVFRTISNVVSPSTILATNTSAIRISEIADGVHKPERLVGTHWWNPPFLTPLVEVIEATATAPETVTGMIDLLERVGKVPVHVQRDAPGFIGNRLQHALAREAVALVDAGVCDAETIDKVVKNGFGLRLAALGPMEGADLVGLDLLAAIQEYLLPHLDRSTEPTRLLRQYVSEGRVGVKAGRGFYDWTPTKARSIENRLVDHLVAMTRQPQGVET